MFVFNDKSVSLSRDPSVAITSLTGTVARAPQRLEYLQLFTCHPRVPITYDFVLEFVPLELLVPSEYLADQLNQDKLRMVTYMIVIYPMHTGTLESKPLS